MGGNSNINSKKQLKKASPIAFFSFFKPSAKRRTKVEDCSWDNSVKADKVRRSDEDRGRSVADPDIDRKASAYIARFHAANKNNVNGAAAADQQ